MTILDSVVNDRYRYVGSTPRNLPGFFHAHHLKVPLVAVVLIPKEFDLCIKAGVLDERVRHDRGEDLKWIAVGGIVELAISRRIFRQSRRRPELIGGSKLCDVRACCVWGEADQDPAGRDVPLLSVVVRYKYTTGLLRVSPPQNQF